jgi:putative redox protein
MAERVTLRTSGGGRVEATNGASTITLDVPKEDGGEGQGLGPHETLLASLGACTAMTLRIYAKRKQWPLEGVELTVERGDAVPGELDAPSRIALDMRLLGPLSEEQRARLADVAKKCPVYKTLSGRIEIAERLAP